MKNMHWLFSSEGTLDRKGFWITLLLSLFSLHVILGILTFIVYEGNPISNMYSGLPLPDALFPNLMIAALWPIAILTWLLILTVTTLAFAKRLADIKVPKVLAVTFPLTMIWINFSFGNFGGLSYSAGLFNEESLGFTALVFIIYAAGFFTLTASLLPSKK